MSKKSATFSVRILTQFQTVYEGPAFSLSTKDTLGALDVLAEHASFVGLLPRGDITVKTPAGDKHLSINSAIMHVDNNQVDIFVNSNAAAVGNAA